MKFEILRALFGLSFVSPRRTMFLVLVFIMKERSSFVFGKMLYKHSIISVDYSFVFGGESRVMNDLITF